MTKYCPFLKMKESGIRSSMCIESDCALWNETQSKCGLACTSQPEQPSRQPLSKYDVEKEKQRSGLLEE